MPRRRPNRRRLTTDLAPDTAAPADDDDAAFDAAPERGPHRRCIVTREPGERARLLRFVLGPDGAIVPDLAARLPGRGLWLSARADVLNSPRVRQAFARAARSQVVVPADLVIRLQMGLRVRIGDLIGLARRSGQAVAGFHKAHEWLVAGRAGVIVQASDGSAEERVRFMGARTDVKAIAPLSGRALGAMFGRDEAVHVAVAHGKLAGMLLIEAERLAGVMGDGPSHAQVAGLQGGDGAAPLAPAGIEDKTDR